jgi:hypothetical protein
MYATQLEADRNKSIWEVDDRLLRYPEAKFRRDFSPLIEATLENWGCGSFEGTNIPDDLTKFVMAFTSMFRLAPSRHVKAADVIYSCITRIDYHTPYFLLTNTKVQLTRDHYQYTYKVKDTGETLSPSSLEVFAPVPGWDFAPYYNTERLLSGEAVQTFLKGNYLPDKYLREHGNTNLARKAAIDDILERVMVLINEDAEVLGYSVEEDLNCFYEGICSEGNPLVNENMSDSFTTDYSFWLAASVATMLWFRSPRAMPYLVMHHPVYGLLFDVDHEGNVTELTSSGGKVIVDGHDIYPLSRLVEFKNAPPGTCEVCGTQAHCTKFLNLNGLRGDTCSCGSGVDPRDVRLEEHNGRLCQAYLRARPAQPGFICQKCLYDKTRGTTEPKCGRMTCPATGCRHHMGDQARIWALTQQRTKQLTSLNTR